MAVLATAALIFWSLVWGLKAKAIKGYEPGAEMVVWAAVATFSMVVWLLLLVLGVRQLLRFRSSGHGDAAGPSGAWLRFHLLVFGLMVAAVVGGLLASRLITPLRYPVEGFEILIAAFQAVAAAAIAPWVLSAWWLHARISELDDASRKILEAREENKRYVLTDLSNDAAVIARQLWRAIERCLAALAAAVSTFVLLSGTLRTALLAWSDFPESAFPPVLVLAYGAVFTLALAAIIGPVVLAWRQATESLIDATVGSPDTPIPTKDWFESRDALHTRLRSAGTLGRPSTWVGLLSPFATALLTYLIPLSS